jgi:predicted O-methyltransferase YrrM
MDDAIEIVRPAVLDAIQRDSVAAGFSMASEERTGALLRTLAASKPAGAMLELGTGTGISTAWILDGMSARASLITVESDIRFAEIARRHLGADRRITFHVGDGAAFLKSKQGRKFDLIFADTWPGKFDHLDEALDLLAPGALYLIDDLLPQPNWPEGHAAKIAPLISRLENDPRLTISRLSWSSGILIAARRSDL